MKRIAHTVVALGCVATLAACQQASARQGGSPQAASEAGKSEPAGAWIEFDLPDPKLMPLLQKPGAIRFLVGYFPAEGSDKKALFIYTVASKWARQSGAAAVRVPLQHWDPDKGRQAVVIRMKTVTAEGPSEWSTPTEPVPVEVLSRQPVVQTLAQPGPAAGRAGQAPAGVPPKTEKSPAATPPAPKVPTAEERLRKEPALRRAIERRFPAVKIAEAASGFPRLMLFVATLCASENLQVRFEDLKPLTVSGEGDVLAKAIAKLKPQAKAEDEAKKAQQQARKIIDSAQKAAR